MKNSRIKITERQFTITLNESEVRDLVLAIDKFREHPNAAHNIKSELTEALGYTPKDMDVY